MVLAASATRKCTLKIGRCRRRTRPMQQLQKEPAASHYKSRLAEKKPSTHHLQRRTSSIPRRSLTALAVETVLSATRRTAAATATIQALPSSFTEANRRVVVRVPERNEELSPSIAMMYSQVRRDASKPRHARKQGSQIGVGKHLPPDIKTHLLKSSREHIVRNTAATSLQCCLQNAIANVLQLGGRARAHDVVGARCKITLQQRCHNTDQSNRQNTENAVLAPVS